MVWEDIESPSIKCEGCDALLSDTERREAIRRGEWRPTAPFKGKRGYHLNGLYSLFPPRRGFKTRLHQAVVGFLDAKSKGAESLKTWINTFLAETWKVENTAVETAGLQARARDYQCPESFSSSPAASTFKVADWNARLSDGRKARNRSVRLSHS